MKICYINPTLRLPSLLGWMENVDTSTRANVWGENCNFSRDSRDFHFIQFWSFSTHFFSQYKNVECTQKLARMEGAEGWLVIELADNLSLSRRLCCKINLWIWLLFCGRLLKQCKIFTKEKHWIFHWSLFFTFFQPLPHHMRGSEGVAFATHIKAHTKRIRNQRRELINFAAIPVASAIQMGKSSCLPSKCYVFILTRLYRCFSLFLFICCWIIKFSRKYLRKFNIKYLNYEVFMLSYNLGGASNEWNEEADEWERESELVQMQFSIWIAEEISYQTSRIIHTALRGKVDVINRKIIWKSFVRYFSTLKLSSPLDVNLILKRKWYKRVFRYPTCSAICKCANVVYPVSRSNHAQSEY